MLSTLAGIAVRVGPLPRKFIHEVLLSEDLVAYDLEEMGNVPANVEIERAVICQEVMDQDQALKHHRQVGLVSGAPGVAVRMLLEDRRSLCEVRITDPQAEREVSARVEWRIDIHKFDLAGVLPEQAGHDELVVSPDEPVPLRPGLRTAREQGSRSRSRSGPGLVDRLDGLERQIQPLHAVRLALPLEANRHPGTWLATTITTKSLKPTPATSIVRLDRSQGRPARLLRA